jgi:hypothetical protein
MQIHALIAFIFVLVAAGCTTSVPTRAELVANPAAYEGRTVFLADSVAWSGACNAAFCEAGAPCNNCFGSYVLPGSDPEIWLVAGDPWPYTERTSGTPTQSCYDERCDGGEPLGCNGNDLEVHCAPAIPSRIVGVEGHLERDTELSDRWVFVVSRVELADGPTEETFEANTGTLLMTETIPE